MPETEIPAHFTPADHVLCEIAKKFDGETTKRFVAVYPAGSLMAVNDGVRIDASWIQFTDAEGQSLRDLLLATNSPEPRALVLDLWRPRCWITSAPAAVSFIATTLAATSAGSAIPAD